MNVSQFNWYKRYKVRAQDLTDFQEFLVNQSHALGDGTFQGAVIKGMDITPSTGMEFSVSEGIAISASGYTNVLEVAEDVTPVAPTGSLKRSLLVIRPKLEGEEEITNPTAPFEQVFLRVKLGCELVVIDGTESATPAYPAKEYNDVIVAGLRLYVGQTAFTEDDIDWEVREIPGKNGETQQRTFMSDDRCRPYRSDYRTLGIKPSRKLGKGPTAFLYPGKGTPSLFPMTGGVFTNSDALLNFETGAITGGDGDSANFTPTVPTSGNSIVATVVLKPNDTLDVLYGTQGTRAQCLAAIENQTTSGAGSINAASSSYKICYVVVTSISGAIADIEVFDCRAIGGGAGGSGSGINIDWIEDVDAPTPTMEGNIRAYEYEDGQLQQLFGSFKVPDTYSSGTQIRMKSYGHSAGTSGVVLMATVATLIRAGTDAITSTTNQRTSTNSGYTLGAGTVDKPQSDIFDLTDSTGKINGVSVSPGDTIGIKLYRSNAGGDTATASMKMLAKQSELLFG